MLRLAGGLGVVTVSFPSGAPKGTGAAKPQKNLQVGSARTFLVWVLYVLFCCFALPSVSLLCLLAQFCPLFDDYLPCGFVQEQKTLLVLTQCERLQNENSHGLIPADCDILVGKVGAVVAQIQFRVFRLLPTSLCGVGTPPANGGGHPGKPGPSMFPDLGLT